jgi:multicomponent Na+:H+ antiporter subunit D
MSGPELILAGLAYWPALTLALIWLGRLWRPGLYAIHIGAAVALAGLVWLAIDAYGHGARLSFAVARPLPALELALTLDPLGLTFAALFAGLHLAIALFTVGHDLVSRDRRLGARFAAFSMIAAAAVGAALARDLLTLITMFAVLGLAMFATSLEAGAHARAQLAAMLAGAFALAAPGAAWLFSLIGDLRIGPGGVTPDGLAPATALGLYGLLVGGLGLSLMAPFSFWLRRVGEQAPAPTAATLQAVAAPAIALCVLKVSLHVFGADAASAAPAPQLLQSLAWATALGAGLIGLTRQDLEARLALIGVGQGALAIAALASGGGAAAFGAALQIISWALAMACLSMVAGAVRLSTGRAGIGDLDGVGRRMPVTFVAFGIAALSLAGLAPFAGAWAKLWLAAGAGANSDYVSVGLALATALVSLALLAPVAARSLFWPAPVNPFVRPDSLPLALVAPIAALGLALVAMLWAIDPIGRFIWPELGQ